MLKQFPIKIKNNVFIIFSTEKANTARVKQDISKGFKFFTAQKFIFMYKIHINLN